MTSDYDIAILGGGPVGQTMALLLAAHAPDPTRIALLTATPAPAAASGDPRVLAMNHGSRVLLDGLAAWPARTATIDTIHVSQRGRLGRAVIRHDDFGVPALGYVTAYAALHDALSQRLAASGVTVLARGPAKVEQSNRDGVDIIQGDNRLRAALAIQCDGRARDDVKRDYGQHAVLATARASLPRAGWAWERFTQGGPLALLPHPEIAGGYSVVWCCAPAHAAALQAMDAHDFGAALNAAYGARMGTLTVSGDRHVFPLALSMRREQVEGRVVTIGNAAQSLHPVAGQGLNLGLRDAAALSIALSPWQAVPAIPLDGILKRFAESRRADRWTTAGLTDLMPRAFATGMAPVEHACGAALLALDLSATLRRPLARHLLFGRRA
ncbi:UbiH/UbiF/VisC/COQ6 family ubiquinone biosynthesis hydroxylase [Alcaligenaceae bacterium C4P045]|nr:UbiH/UbiF/VisC/COQ6 family ubiquinone biosynthesis hydroxylase [Alcaligenaceae bacterium C4P045]